MVSAGLISLAINHRYWDPVTGEVKEMRMAEGTMRERDHL